MQITRLDAWRDDLCFRVWHNIRDHPKSLLHYWLIITKNILEIIRHHININEKTFSHFIAEKFIFRIIV